MNGMVAQQQAEAALQEHEELYRTVFRTCPAGTIIWDKEARIIDWNPAAERIFGWTREEAMAQSHPDFLVPEQVRPYMDRMFAQLSRIKLPIESVHENVTREGRFILCDWRNIPLLDASGGRCGFVSLVEDITKQIRERQSILDVNQRLNALINSSPLAILTFDLHGTVLSWNPAAERMFGWREHEVVGRPLPALRPENQAEFRTLVERVLRGEAFTGFETCRRRRDGSPIEVSISEAPLRDVGDNVTGVLSVVADITERKRAEREIIAARETAERTRAEVEDVNQQLEEAVLRANELATLAERESQSKSVLLAAIPSILIGVDAEDRITQWNPAAEACFSIPSREVLGKTFANCGIRWDWSMVTEGIREGRRGNRPARLRDTCFTRPDGEERVLGITINPLNNTGGDWAGFLLLAADITDRKLLEAQLTQAQKLESIGQLAAGIAHEINTPTQYIGDNTRFLQEAFGDLQNLFLSYDTLLSATKTGDVTPELVDAVEAAAERADMDYLMAEIPKAIQESLEGTGHVARIVQAMKEFSHPGTEEKTAVDINRAIESTITVARHEWKYVADVVTDFDPDMPLVPCLPGNFNQVILNIIVNAAHAIADVIASGTTQKGCITVSTRRHPDRAEIRIRDTGTGIPEAIRTRIFDPFFTTKEVGKGTGQGLAIAHGIIVEKHGGRIHFETEAGQGTTFVISLPLDKDQVL